MIKTDRSRNSLVDFQVALQTAGKYSETDRDSDTAVGPILRAYLVCEVSIVLVSHLEEQRPPVKSHPGI